MLVNNNFHNTVVYRHIRKFIAKKCPHITQPNEEAPAEAQAEAPAEELLPEENTDINLYYWNQMTRNYKHDENYRDYIRKVYTAQRNQETLRADT